MKRHLIISFFCLLAGLANYLIFRREILFIDFLYAKDIFNNYQLKFLPDYIIYFNSNYLSDILWVTSIYQFSLICIKYNLPDLYYFLLIFIPAFSEIGQYYKVISGTFDLFDMIIYVSFIFITLNYRLCQKLKNIYSGVS